MKTLKLAFIHANIRHKQPESNRAVLIDLIGQAARQGADIVVTPEMAISGYAFSSRADILPYAETEGGPTLSSLVQIVKKAGIHVCIGLAEKDAYTGMLYNSAFVLGPDGHRLCRYRKINAESRWACPGNPKENNTFATPWGRVGVLICSDSYHSLMPRVTALRGADLLLVPANWPPTGLVPQEIWRARSLENGFYVAACNRTGVDLSMDCRQASSAVFDSCGKSLLDTGHPDSRIFYVDLPLNKDNKLDAGRRQQCLAARYSAGIHDCYLNLTAISDLTSFLNLPPAGHLPICCPVPGQTEDPLELLQRGIKETHDYSHALHILPAANYSDGVLALMEKLCTSSNHLIALRRDSPGGSDFHLLKGNGHSEKWPMNPHPETNEGAFAHFDYGPARCVMAPFSVLQHPEAALAAAKRGCDLAIASEMGFSTDDRLLAGARTIDNLAIAVCARDHAGVWMSPEGHQRWEEHLARPGDICRYTLDTGRTRKKRFQDKIDFECLLSQRPSPCP